MKKITLLLIGLLLALPAAAQTQKGYVKTPGRLGAGGALIPGKRLAGAYVKVRGRQGVRSNDKGDFALPVDRNFYVERAELAGYTVVDRDLLSRRYDYSAGNPLIVVLEKPDTQLQDKLAAERKIRRTLRQQLDKREAELDRLREEQRITQARYDSLLRALYEDQSKSEKLIADMAERYASIDFDQQDDLNRRISACILNGELERADSLLRTKGDIHERAATLQRHRSLNDAEAEELARRQESLDQSRRLEAHNLEELAADCYRRHELCLVEHRNDSAAYYLRFRAALDTTNGLWALDAGDFVREYLADYPTALAYYECALRNARTKYGERNPDVAMCYLNMGNVYYSQGRYDEALSNYSLALDIRKSVYGERHPDVAGCYNNMGGVYNSQGRYDEALSNYSLALEILKSVYGERHPDVAACYIGMGNVYDRQGRYDEALSNYSLALDIKKSVYGERHPDVAMCYNNMGNVYYSQGRYDEALSNYSLALEILKSVYGERHPDVAACYSNMGLVYYSQGRYDEALSNYSLALEILKSVYGERHPDVAACYNNMGLVYVRQGRRDEALSNYSLALDIKKSVYGERHPDVAMCYTNMGGTYALQKCYADALQYFQKALSIYEEILPEGSPRIAKIKNVIEKIKSLQSEEN